MTYQIHKADLSVTGEINLDGSKSISNRVLIIRALSGHDFDIHKLSNSKHTLNLKTLLQKNIRKIGNFIPQILDLFLG